MSEQEFLALKPREQDALVAEKVMGWTRYDDEYWNEGPYTSFEYTPHYTIYISSAWKVVEKFESNNVAEHKLRGTDVVHDWNWSVEIARLDTDEWSVSLSGYDAEAPTAPLAICIASLRACGVIED